MSTLYHKTMGLLVFLGLLTFCFFSSCFSSSEANTETNSNSIPEYVDFNFHVKPILSDRCFKCHGPDKNTREGNLRLDTQEGAFSTEHEAIIAGDVEKSTLIQRIFTEDPTLVMPPPESNLLLTSSEKEILKKMGSTGSTVERALVISPHRKTSGSLFA